MQKLRKQAEEASGTPFSAVEAARNAHLYDRLGADKLHALSDAFYARVYADKDGLRKVFGNTTREAAARNQREFFTQEFGGPRLYEMRKGPTMLLGRHAPYAVDAAAAVLWLQHMRGALDDVKVHGECRVLLDGYFQHMASFVVLGRELVNPGRTIGYNGKHSVGNI